MRWFALLAIMAIVSASDVLDTPQGRWSGRWIEVAATAYTPTNAIDSEYHASKGTRWRWILADGRTNVLKQPYGLAVKLTERDGKWRPALPYGTQVYIPTGYGYLDRIRSDDRVFPVDDGSASSRYAARIGGRMHVDMRWISTSEALRWAGPEGHRNMRVFVIERELPRLVGSVQTWPHLMPEVVMPRIPLNDQPRGAAVIMAGIGWSLVGTLALLPIVVAVVGTLLALSRRA